MKPPPIPASWWVTENLLVSATRGRTVALPVRALARLRAAGVSSIFYLLGRQQFREAGPEALFGGLVAPADPASSERTPPKLHVNYSFWAESGALPSAREVRLTLDAIDEAHTVNLSVCIHGADRPARAILAAGCWLARHGPGAAESQDPHAARLGWLELARRTASGGGATGVWTLDDAERAFVCAWPSGRNAEPVLTAMELLDDEEVFPTATVEHWLSVLETVRVYPFGRDGVFVRAQVNEPGAQVTHKKLPVPITIQEMHEGTWVGERTLRLRSGAVIVFI